MLVLGLLIGAVAGGVAGFFMGQNTRIAFNQRLPNNPGFPPFTQPRRQQTPPPAQPQQTPQPQPTPSGRGFPPAQNVLGAAQVQMVEQDSPADKAGLKVGDLITAVGSVKLDANHTLADLISAQKPGDKVDLSVTRGNQTMVITVTLGASPQDSTKAYLGIRYSTVPGNFRFPNG
jgi:hypothetical protein